MIACKGKGRGQSIGKKADDVFTHACGSHMIALFPKPKARNNAYYMIGFLGIQAGNHANCLAKDSKRQLCLPYFAAEWFAVCKKGGQKVVEMMRLTPPLW